MAVKEGTMNKKTLGKRAIGVFVGIGLFLVGALTASAQPAGGTAGWRHHDPDRAILAQAYAKALAQMGEGSLGDVKLGQLEHIFGQLSIARQQYAYVKRSEIASYFVPGAGQFMNGAPGAGALFLTGNIAVIAGTVLGAYFLLPSNLHLDQINWFTAPYATVKSSFESHSFVDYLPSIAMVVGGSIVDQILRVAAAKNAGSLARERVSEGKVIFQPEPLFMPPEGWHGGWGVGFGMRARF